MGVNAQQKRQALESIRLIHGILGPSVPIDHVLSILRKVRTNAPTADPHYRVS